VTSREPTPSPASQYSRGNGSAIPFVLARKLPRESTIHRLTLLAILLVATGVRLWRLGSLSFWYDEVVTMRLAEAANVGTLIDRLFQIDATRAPLHPLLLQEWLRVFGTSEAAGRSFSVVCGVLTVGLICWIAAQLRDFRTGLWAAWFASLSPLLLYYSREARMYSWLVLLTTLSWGLQFSLRRSQSRGQRFMVVAAYLICLTALLYSHPLGILMFGTLGLGSLVCVGDTFGSIGKWLAAHLAALAPAVPWISHYFDHAPEFLTGRLPIKFLLGMPIGFIGGNFLVLSLLCGMIVLGLMNARRGREFARAWAEPFSLCLWFSLPPLCIYTYSWIGSPIFGPARYTLYVAPAYLILLANGLTQLPALVRYPAGIAIAIVSLSTLPGMVFDKELKSDWRGASLMIAGRLAERPEKKVSVLVASADPARNVEVETARYYLPPDCTVVAWESQEARKLAESAQMTVYLAVGSRRGVTVVPIPDRTESLTWVFDQGLPGLTLYRGERR
jgi:mannosyltransferase